MNAADGPPRQSRLTIPSNSSDADWRASLARCPSIGSGGLTRREHRSRCRDSCLSCLATCGVRATETNERPLAFSCFACAHTDEAVASTHPLIHRSRQRGRRPLHGDTMLYQANGDPMIAHKSIPPIRRPSRRRGRLGRSCATRPSMTYAPSGLVQSKRRRHPPDGSRTKGIGGPFASFVAQAWFSAASEWTVRAVARRALSTFRGGDGSWMMMSTAGSRDDDGGFHHPPRRLAASREAPARPERLVAATTGPRGHRRRRD